MRKREILAHKKRSLRKWYGIANTLLDLRSESAKPCGYCDIADGSEMSCRKCKVTKVCTIASTGIPKQIDKLIDLAEVIKDAIDKDIQSI
jgi:hypothetical protein